MLHGGEYGFSSISWLWQVCKELGARWLVTADHGNADDMVQRNKKDNSPAKDKEGNILLLTSHTLAPVR